MINISRLFIGLIALFCSFGNSFSFPFESDEDTVCSLTPNHFNPLPLPLTLPTLNSSTLTPDSCIKLSLQDSTDSQPPKILSILALLDRLKNQIIEADKHNKRLTFNTSDVRAYENLLREIEEGAYDYNEIEYKEDTSLPSRKEKYLHKQQIEAFSSALQKLKNEALEERKEVSPSQIHNLFYKTISSSCLSSPIKVGGNTFIFPHGGTPPSKLTPERRQNLSRLWQGQAPIMRVKGLRKNLLEDFNTASSETEIIEEQNLHHLAQENEDIVFCLPYTWHKKYHKGLHIHPNGHDGFESQINRSRFRKSKDRAFRLLSLKKNKERLRSYQRHQYIKKS